jgi:hypothetical protein
LVFIQFRLGPLLPAGFGFEAQLARLGEHDRALGGERMLNRMPSPRLQRALAQIVAAEPQKVESGEQGLSPTARRGRFDRRPGRRPPAVDQRPLS